MNCYCLFRRNNVFYFRIRIPKGLQSPYEGRTEIKRSLKTQDINKAALLSSLMNASVKKIFKEIKASMHDKELIKRLVEKQASDELEMLEEAWLLGGPDTNPQLNKAARELLYEHALENLKNNKLSTVENNADSIIAESKENIEKHSLAYKKLCRDLLVSNVKVKRIIVGKGNGEYPEDLVPLVVTQSTQPSIPAVQATVVSLKELVDRYAGEKVSSGNWDYKTELAAKAIFKLLMEHFSKDIDIKSITREMFLDFRNNVLMKMPGNRTKNRKTRGKSLDNVLKMKQLVYRNHATTNDDITRISSFFKWCVRNDYMVKNIAEETKITIKARSDEERNEYDKDDLTKVAKAIKEFKSKKPYMFWIPLVALFCGMRQNEICQLYVDDVIKDSGIDSFDINAKTKDKKIKNSSSIRTVPIHPLLLKLGFMGYVSKQKKSGSDRLWPQLKHRRDGYGQSFQRKFARLNRHLITANPKKVFHSFRHNFSNNLKQNRAQVEIISELMGHSLGSITLERYGKRYSSENKLDTVNKLDYGVDFLKLLS